MVAYRSTRCNDFIGEPGVLPAGRGPGLRADRAIVVILAPRHEAVSVPSKTRPTSNCRHGRAGVRKRSDPREKSRDFDCPIVFDSHHPSALISRSENDYSTAWPPADTR